MREKGKLEYQSLSQLAYKHIKKLILEGVLKPGEKLAQENIARDLGVSRIPLIRALAMLERERLLEARPRKGVYVREISHQELIDILDVRILIESYAAARMARSLTAKQKVKLLAFLRQYKRYLDTGDYERYRKTDMNFHYYLVNSCGNETLISINETFNILLLSLYKGLWIDPQISYPHHKALIEAIISGNSQKAQDVVREHLMKAQEGVREKMTGPDMTASDNSGGRRIDNERPRTIQA